jgi:hypothetical protein
VVAPLGCVGVRVDVLVDVPVVVDVDVDVPVVVLVPVPVLVPVSVLVPVPVSVLDELTANPGGIENGSRTGNTSATEGCKLGVSLAVWPVLDGLVGNVGLDVVSSSTPPLPSTFITRKPTRRTPRTTPPILSVRLSRSVMAISATHLGRTRF